MNRRTPLPMDPLEAVLAMAPYSDEPLTDEERAASEEGWAEYLRGETFSFADVFGRPDDFDRAPAQ